jgi:hypothetical protein
MLNQTFLVRFVKRKLIDRYRALENAYLKQFQSELVPLTASQRLIMMQRNVDCSHKCTASGQVEFSPDLLAGIEKFDSFNNEVDQNPVSYNHKKAFHTENQTVDEFIDFGKGRDFHERALDPLEMSLGKEAVDFWQRHKWDDYSPPFRPDLRTFEDVVEANEFNATMDEIAEYLENLMDDSRDSPLPLNSNDTSNRLDHEMDHKSENREFLQNGLCDSTSNPVVRDCLLGELPTENWRNPSPPDSLSAERTQSSCSRFDGRLRDQVQRSYHELREEENRPCQLEPRPPSPGIGDEFKRTGTRGDEDARQHGGGSARAWKGSNESRCWNSKDSAPMDKLLNYAQRQNLLGQSDLQKSAISRKLGIQLKYYEPTENSLPRKRWKLYEFEVEDLR